MRVVIPKKFRLIRVGVSLLSLAIIMTAGLVLFQKNSDDTLALSGSDFKAGHIIDDIVFYDEASMSAADIQSFLNTRVPSCDTNGSQRANEYGRGDITRAQYAATQGWHGPPYTCMKDYRQNVPNMEAASGLCGGISGANNLSAAEIIERIAKACHISPKVLLVLLQKEQSLVTDTWPLNGQYAKATGFDCPDTAPCDPAFGGFFYQTYYAARQFQVYKKYPTSYNYVAGRNNNIYFHPGPYVNGAKQSLGYCGSSQVFIQNQATAALYIYTPYQPDGAALNNLYGTGGTCSSYGNRNFWRLFTDWFGSTYAYQLGNNVKPGYQSWLGVTTTNEICGIKNNGCYQMFENGTIYWSSQTGAHTIGGGIREKWSSVGSEWSKLGYPTSNEMYGSRGGGAYQIFENGRIYYTNSGKSYVILNDIYTRWNQGGAEWSNLGYPKTDTICGLKSNGCYQIFQNDITIYYSPVNGAYTMAGGIRAKWASAGSEWGQLGYPTSNERYGTNDGGAYQLFEKGRIYYTSMGKAYVILNDIYARWSQSDAEKGILGYPKTDTICGIKGGGCYQIFQNDITIYWSQASGAYTIAGGIRDKWRTTNSEWGRLGYPTSNEHYDTEGAYQTFQGGTIHWSYTTSSARIVYNP